MAEESKRECTQDEITDDDLNALFDQLSLGGQLITGIPDPPSTAREDWVLGTLILDPPEANCEYITDWYHAREHRLGRLVRRICNEHEWECDIYSHAVWRAGNGRDVRTLTRCDVHLARLSGLCKLCLGTDIYTLEDDNELGSNVGIQHAYRSQRVRGRRTRRKYRVQYNK